jgi:LacI family transcriptional regulator, galactose operon repressor
MGLSKGVSVPAPDSPRRHRRPTVADVAEAAGVSATTVSMLLNGKPLAVSEATRERVMQAVEELQYTPNAMTLALRRGRTNIIGFAFALQRPHTNPFAGAVFDGLRTGAAEAGYDVLVYRVPPAGSAAVKPAALLDGRADAVVLWPNQLTAPLRQLARTAQPTVAILTDGAPPEVGQVNVDNDLLARLLVEHLTALGHRRAGFVFEHPTRPLHLQERLAALRAAGAGCGLEIVEGEAADAEQAARLLARWHDGGAPSRVTAVLASYERLVRYITAGTEQAGLRIPDDLSLATTEAFDADGVAPPDRVTAVVLPLWEVGRQAALDAAALVDGGAPQRRRLPVQLVTGRSTGPVGSGSK